MDMKAECAELREMVINGELSRTEYDQRLFSIFNQLERSEVSMQPQLNEIPRDDRPENARRAFLFGPRRSYWISRPVE